MLISTLGLDIQLQKYFLAVSFSVYHKITHKS